MSHTNRSANAPLNSGEQNLGQPDPGQLDSGQAGPTTGQAGGDRMPLVAALAVLAEHRGPRVVVSTMGPLREWVKLSNHPLDLNYIPSAMGHAPMIGLGLALAQPQHEIVVLNGDGCMWMGLGSLVTAAAAGASNFTLIVFDNGIYEVTGGQQTAAWASTADLAGLARAAGFASVEAFDRLELWQRGVQAALRSPGPRFIHLRVEPVGQAYALPTLPSLPKRLQEFRYALHNAPAQPSGE